MKAASDRAAMRHTVIVASLIAIFGNSITAHADTITRNSITQRGAWSTAPGQTNGQIETVQADANDGGTSAWEVDTNATYDANGNLLNKRLSTPSTAAGKFTSRTTVTYTYDTAGQFPIQEKNALNQTTQRTFDPVSGNELTETAPDGTITTWQYDSFGRPILQKNPDGTQIKTAYIYCNGVAGGTASCPANAVFINQSTPLASDGVTQNGPITSSYVDILGRTVRTETQGFDGVSLIRVDTIYDNQGRVYQKSRPYYAGQTIEWATFSYDALGRLIGTALPDNTSTSVSYNGLTKVETNALGNTRTTVTNSQGQVTQVTDAQGNTLTYKYNAAGNLLKTTDPAGNSVSMSYDVLGHPTQMVDADMGTWSYSYDLLGNLLSQTDAKNNTVTNTFDLLNRTTKTTEPDLTSTFTYDSCTNGVGKLCSSTANNGYAKSNTFDTLGRPTSISTTVDTAYTSSKTYDANGRIATATYPNGVVLKYVYTSLGYLQQIQDNASGKVYWTANSKDAEGHLLQQTYGNGIVTQLVYNAANGRLQNVYAGTGNALQNLTFSYDANGNMLSRTDANQSLSETFLYDSLNRATSNSVNSSGAGVYTQGYVYDPLGNISSRSDVGTYTYGAVNAQPHAVTNVALASGGSMQYSYDVNGNQTRQVVKDANGNVVATAGRSETYTSYNMPATITAPNASFSFTYGTDHGRVKMVGPNATTIYLNPDKTGGLFYEKDIHSDGSVEHRNFVTAGGTVIGIIKQEVVSGTTTTNVVYLHRDHLGSTTAVTDASGNTLENFGYEPFGKRRFVNGMLDPNDTVKAVNTDRGYSNHEQLDAVSLINMNGRIFDPAIGRFVSADPNIPHPGEIQSYNRYAYTRNNPMIMLDPSGFEEICLGCNWITVYSAGGNSPTVDNSTPSGTTGGNNDGGAPPVTPPSTPVVSGENTETQVAINTIQSPAPSQTPGTPVSGCQTGLQCIAVSATSLAGSVSSAFPWTINFYFPGVPLRGAAPVAGLATRNGPKPPPANGVDSKCVQDYLHSYYGSGNINGIAGGGFGLNQTLINEGNLIQLIPGMSDNWFASAGSFLGFGALKVGALKGPGYIATMGLDGTTMGPTASQSFGMGWSNVAPKGAGVLASGVVSYTNVAMAQALYACNGGG